MNELTRWFWRMHPIARLCRAGRGPDALMFSLVLSMRSGTQRDGRSGK